MGCCSLLVQDRGKASIFVKLHWYRKLNHFNHFPFIPREALLDHSSCVGVHSAGSSLGSLTLPVLVFIPREALLGHSSCVGVHSKGSSLGSLFLCWCSFQGKLSWVTLPVLAFIPLKALLGHSCVGVHSTGRSFS